MADISLASAASAASSLLLMVFLIEPSHALDPTASAPTSVEYWQMVLPSFPLPARLLEQVSALDSSLALVTRYTHMMSSQPAGVQPDMSSLCMTGHLYCNSSQFRQRLKYCNNAAYAILPYYQLPSSLTFSREKQLSQGSSFTVFRERDLVEGALLSLRDPKVCPPPTRFLPRQLANKLRLASATHLHAAFGIPPSSSLARESIRTLQSLCKPNAKPLLPGEEAFCAYSLEDLADELKRRMVADASGASLQLLPVSSISSTDAAQARLLKVKLEVEGTQPYLACHPQTYPFAVNRCHHVPNTRIYSVTFETTHASSSKIVHAVAICHMNTTPGRTETCHWTQGNSLIFVATTT